MRDFDRKILAALVDAGGQISCAELKSLYTEKGDGMRHAMMVRSGLTEWVRPNDHPCRSAIAVKITDAGCARLKTAEGREGDK